MTGTKAQKAFTLTFQLKRIDFQFQKGTQVFLKSPHVIVRTAKV